MNKLIMNNKTVYHSEIIHPVIFKNLYIKETPIDKFLTKITINTERPFATFYSKDRKENEFKGGDIILLRINKKNNQFQFVSKLQKWGKFHVPRRIIKTLDIKNHEILKIEIISRNKNISPKNTRSLDLSQIKNEGIKILPRDDNYITIYSKQKIPITLPRFIKITPNLFELFFLIYGDGHYKYKTYFVSKTPELIQFVMNQFEEIFKFPKREWKARILTSKLEEENNHKIYWNKKLNLSEEQFYSVSKTKFKSSKNGNLRIIIDKTIFSLIFNFIFDKLNQINNKETSLHALNGLLDSEGGALPRKGGLHRITISFNKYNKKEKKIFKKIMNNTGLSQISKLENRQYTIEKWSNLHKFFDTFFSKNIIPFNNHNKRKFTAINGFLNHSFTKTSKKYLSILSKYEGLTLEEFSKILNIRKDSILSTIRREQYSKFLKVKGKGINRHPFKISITKKGINLLTLIKTMEEIMPVLTKKQAETNPNFGCNPKERSIETLIHYGAVNINKPQGPTSHMVSDYVQKILNINKAGHSGTLEN